MLREDALALLRNWNDEDGRFAAALADAVISLFRAHPAPGAAPQSTDEMLDAARPLFL
jgi:hypothetical protein